MSYISMLAGLQSIRVADQIRYTTELREVWASGKCPSKQEGLACVAALVPLLTAQDEPVRQTSTAALYCLLEGHKAILRALALENEELMDKVVLQALRGVRDGRGEDADFVAFLMSCEDACVQAACLRTKLLLRVVRLLDSAGHNALRALRTLSPDQLRKFSLFDGPALLSQGLAEGTLDPASAVPVLAAACRAQPDCLTQLASAPRARALAGLVGETAVPAGTQAAAAALLADLAFRPEASPACLELLINEALPRACEVLRDGGAGEALAGACALLAARLAPRSKPACRLIVLHMAALAPAAAALVRTGEYGEARHLLRAAGEFAREP